MKIAAVQATPVFNDLEGSLRKACDLITIAGKEGAAVAVFPEAFISGYPFWVWFVPTGKTKTLRPLYADLVANSVDVPSPAVNRLCAAGRDAGMETILYADVDPVSLTGPRYQLDVAGHYARPDVFSLTVDRRERKLI